MRIKKSMILFFTFMLTLSTFSVPVVEASNQTDVEMKTSNEEDIVEVEDSQNEPENEPTGETSEDERNEVEEGSQSGAEEVNKDPEEQAEDQVKEEAVPNESEQTEAPRNTEETEKQEDTEEVTDEKTTKKSTFSIQKSTTSTFPFQKGDRNNTIKEIKKMLNHIGFGGITVTNYYGAFTAKRVKQFQAYVGLSKTGTVNKTTYNKMKEIYNNPLQKGKHHKSLPNLKKKLNWLGYGKITVTTYFGSFTKSQVEKFQKDHNLPISGIIDKQTEDKINQVFTTTFQKGSRHDSITDLKEKLNRIGFGNIKVTTYYGSFTEKRVMDFQRYYGLNATGKADLRTLEKLDNVSSTPFQRGERHSDTKELKRKLNRLGFGNIKVTTLYGSFTEKRVKDFQRYYGLKVTGIADSRTLEKMDGILNSPLQKGKYNKRLLDLKKKLNWLDYGKITVTTYFGSFTEKQVKIFQRDHDLPISGIIDTKTQEKINQVFSTTFQKGSRHDSIIELKKKLNQIGFGNIKTTTYYGSFTEKRVKDFQRYYGLKVTGKANLATLEKLNKVSATPFQKGKHHEDTKELKRKLNKIGFGTIKVTTYYGSFTEKRVKDFQRYFGLKVTGIADSRTLDKINQVYNSPFQKGKRHSKTKQLKQNLNQLGFGNIQVTTFYGSFTEKRVKDFQRHYGLKVTGIADSRTLDKINDILSSPFQKGKRHPETIKLKEKLNNIGYGYIQVTNLYGSYTEKKVREFQKDVGLPVSGIADEITIKTLMEMKEKRIVTYSQYNVTMEDALNIQMNQLQQTDKYRNNPAYISAKYVKIVTGATISGSYVNLRSTPDFTKAPVINVSKGTKVEIVKTVTGAKHDGSTTWYKIKYQGMTLYVHSSLVNPSAKTATVTANVNVRAEARASSHKYGVLSKGSTVQIISEGTSWHQIEYSAWRNPTRNDVKGYLNPNNHDEFQHLVLSSSVEVPASQLNKVLIGEGILEGLGQAFIDGGKKHAVNEIYLISHALLETGHGTSTLAKGVEVGKNKNGVPVLVTSSNKKRLTDIKTVYNMFGIGAVDSNPLKGGAIRAYKEGWFTPAKAIESGAKFIGSSYVHNQYKQNTLYKMRWNPANPGYPQYATDIGWAVKQVYQIKQMYDKLDNPTLHFDIVKYK